MTPALTTGESTSHRGEKKKVNRKNAVSICHTGNEHKVVIFVNEINTQNARERIELGLQFYHLLMSPLPTLSNHCIHSYHDDRHIHSRSPIGRERKKTDTY